MKQHNEQIVQIINKRRKQLQKKIKGLQPQTPTILTMLRLGSIENSYKLNGGIV